MLWFVSYLGLIRVLNSVFSVSSYILVWRLRYILDHSYITVGVCTKSTMKSSKNKEVSVWMLTIKAQQSNAVWPAGYLLLLSATQVHFLLLYWGIYTKCPKDFVILYLLTFQLWRFLPFCVTLLPSLSGLQPNFQISFHLILEKLKSSSFIFTVTDFFLLRFASERMLEPLFTTHWPYYHDNQD